MQQTSLHCEDTLKIIKGLKIKGLQAQQAFTERRKVIEVLSMSLIVLNTR